MTLKREIVNYVSLNGKQQELYNFHRLAGKLANYGYYSIQLSDDWQGADFLAVHFNGEDSLKVQLKGRMEFNKKYNGKDLFIAFPHGDDFYLYPHDKILNVVLSEQRIEKTASWQDKGHYSWPKPTKWALALLEDYKV